MRSLCGQGEARCLLEAALAKGNATLASSMYRAMCLAAPAKPAARDWEGAAWPAASLDTVAVMVIFFLACFID